MSRYPNRDATGELASYRVPRRPLGYTLGDAAMDPSNPSILFGDPTLGSRTAIEQAAGINQVFDPGAPFGTPTPGAQAQTEGDLASVGITAALQAPNIVIPTATASGPIAGLPSWVKPALWIGLGLITLYVLTRKG